MGVVQKRFPALFPILPDHVIPAAPSLLCSASPFMPFPLLLFAALSGPESQPEVVVNQTNRPKQGFLSAPLASLLDKPGEATDHR